MNMRIEAHRRRLDMINITLLITKTQMSQTHTCKVPESPIFNAFPQLGHSAAILENRFVE